MKSTENTQAERGNSRIRTWAALVPALSVPFMAALFYFLICRDPVTARAIYIAAKVFLVGWPLIAALVVLRARPSAWRTARPQRLRSALAGIACGLAMSAVIVLVMLTPLGALIVAKAGSIRERTEHLGVLKWYWGFGLFLSFAHSLGEEYYWRWFAFGALRRTMGCAAAAAVSAIVFASHHVIITGQLLSWPLGFLCATGIAVGGYAWALLYDRYGSLLGPWVAHVLVDLTVMAIGWQVLTAAQ